MNGMGVFTAGALLLGASIVMAQGRPDFTGTWVPDSTQAAKAGAASTTSGGGRASFSFGGGPVEYRITQTDSSLTIERMSGSGSGQKFDYTFDGKENVNVNNRVTTKTKSRWERGSLITEGTEIVQTVSGQQITATLREVRSLDANGRLVVEATHGSAKPTKRVYARKKG